MHNPRILRSQWSLFFFFFLISNVQQGVVICNAKDDSVFQLQRSFENLILHIKQIYHIRDNLFQDGINSIQNDSIADQSLLGLSFKSLAIVYYSDIKPIQSTNQKTIFIRESSSERLSNVVGALQSPNCIALNCQNLCPVVNIVFSRSSKCILTSQQLLFRSKVENFLFTERV